MTRPTHAVVMGGGLCGMLASAMLSRYADSVTIVDRDLFPDGPRSRKGVPQARHSHVLAAGGARAIESLLPGTVQRLFEAGAHRIGMPTDLLVLTAYGWQHRFPETQFMITCSRDLLEWTVREQVLRDSTINLLEDTDITELCGDASRVTGLRIQPHGSETNTHLEADIVVDATGRGSRMKRWLETVGLSPVEEDIVDAGIAYATRIFRAPEGVRSRFPLISLHADHHEPVPGKGGSLVPIEDGRWIVTLGGTRGGEPPTTEDGWMEFAYSLRHPIIAEFAARAEPLTPVHGTRNTINKYVHFERLASWPEGLVVMGDAVAAFNPVHGHGMSSAALQVMAMEGQLQQYGLGDGMAPHTQKLIGETVDDPWILACSQDICYPDCRFEVTDSRLTNPTVESRRFEELLANAAISDPAISRAAVAVRSLSAPPSSLRSPDVLEALRRKPQFQALTQPPLESNERTILEQVAEMNGSPLSSSRPGGGLNSNGRRSP